MLKLEDYTGRIASVVGAADFAGRSVQLDIEGLGSIFVDGVEVSNAAGQAECQLSTDHTTFDDLFHGRLDPTVAFGQGKLLMEGDMGLALKVPALFARAAAAS